MRRDWQDDPLGRVYTAAVAGDPVALLAIEMMPDRSAPVTKSRKSKRKKAATAQGEVMRNLRWHEQVAALRQRDILKSARDAAASGYDQGQFLRDLALQGSPLAREVAR